MELCAMNTLFLLAIIAIETNGNACAIHANSKIHGGAGMSVAALIDVGRVPEDVHCDMEESKRAAWDYQKRYAALTNYEPLKMARLHSVGPGAFKRGVVNEEYQRRFKLAYYGRR